MRIEATANQSADAVQPTVRQGTPPVLAWLTLFALFVAGTVLRFLFLARKPFWFDECFSVAAARLDWPNFFHLLWWRECNMALYYALLRVWIPFGGTEFFIRSLSVVLAAAGLGAIYWLGCVMFDRRTGMIAVALLSVNAYHIRYAQEARSYSLFFLLATLSSGYFCAYLQKPSRGKLVGYVLTSILAVYAHFYALLLIATQGLALWLSDRQSGASSSREGGDTLIDLVRGLRRAWVWIGFAVLPLVIFIAKTGAGPIRWIQRPGLRDLVNFYEHLAGNEGWPLLTLYVAACAVAMAGCGTKLFSRAERAGGRIWRIRFLLLWLFFPVALTALLSFARPVFLGRYFIFCLPAFIVLAAAGLARLKKPWHLGAALAVILLFSAKGTLAYYDHDFDLDRDGIGVATDFVLDRAQPGDAVIFHIAETRSAYQFYRSLRDGQSGSSQNLAANAGPEIIYPCHENFCNGDRLDYRDFTGKPTSEFLRAVPQRYGRVWVVLMNNGGTSHPDPATLTLSDSMAELFPAMLVWEFPQVEVRLYRKR